MHNFSNTKVHHGEPVCTSVAVDHISRQYLFHTLSYDLPLVATCSSSGNLMFVRVWESRESREGVGLCMCECESENVESREGWAVCACSCECGKVESNNIPHANLLIHSCIHWDISYHMLTHACMCTLPNPLPALYFLVFSHTGSYVCTHYPDPPGYNISYLSYRSTSMKLWRVQSWVVKFILVCDRDMQYAWAYKYTCM